MRRTQPLLALAAFLIFGTPLWSGESEPQILKGQSGKVTLAVPADWSVEAVAVKETLGAWRVTLDDRLFLHLSVRDRKWRRGRSAAYLDRRQVLEQLKASEAVVKVDTVPRIEAVLPNEIGMTLFYPKSQGRIFELRAEYPESEKEKLAGLLLAAARSFASSLPAFPPPPSGYAKSTKGGFRFYYHPSLKKRVGPLVKMAKAVERGFGRRHGKVARDKKDLPTFVICPSKGDAKSFHERAGQSDYVFVAEENRIYGIPQPATQTPQSRASFAWGLAVMLLDGKYKAPETQGTWFSNGEVLVTWAEAVIQKPLPSVHVNYYNDLPDTLMSLDKLKEILGNRRLNQDQKRAQRAYRTAFVYVAFFHKGPKKFKAAYAAFLKEWAATGDWETAEKRHIGALDQEALRAAADKFAAKKLKPFELK